MKPRKKVLCNVKSRTKRKPLSSVSTKGGYSSDESTDNEHHSHNHNHSHHHGNHYHHHSNNNTDTEAKHHNNATEIADNALRTLTAEALHRIRPGSLVPVGVLLTRCTADVNWQDGTVTRDIPTGRLIPQIYSIDEHEFFPGDFVSHKFDPLNPSKEQSMHNFGTIISANSKDRVAKVQWFDYVASEAVIGCGVDNGNEVANGGEQGANEATNGDEKRTNGAGGGTVAKSGDLEEVGVYDICALNEHHFVLGQEVIIKQEVAHRNYPAGYVTRLQPDDGLLVIRWPDGQELPMSPTDLLLTVESAIGGGSESSDESGYDLSDDLSSELHSDSDSTDWETVEEEEANQSDESYLSKLM